LTVIGIAAHCINDRRSKIRKSPGIGQHYRSRGLNAFIISYREIVGARRQLAKNTGRIALPGRIAEIAIGWRSARCSGNKAAIVISAGRVGYRRCDYRLPLANTRQQQECGEKDTGIGFPWNGVMALRH